LKLLQTGEEQEVKGLRERHFSVSSGTDLARFVQGVRKMMVHVSKKLTTEARDMRQPANFPLLLSFVSRKFCGFKKTTRSHKSGLFLVNQATQYVHQLAALPLYVHSN
jgi:hypothetical protein